VAFVAYAPDHRCTPLAQLGEETRNLFRRVLQVVIDRDHFIAARIVQAAQRRMLLTLVARKLHYAQSGVGTPQALQRFIAVVRTRIVDENHLPGPGFALEHGLQALNQSRQERRAAIDRYDYADRRRLHAPLPWLAIISRP
jgi:hypothetical protein